jgi:hypothetical protein
MRSVLIIPLTMFTFFAVLGRTQAPEGFSWVNLQSDKTTITSDRHALHSNRYTSIRKVGLKDRYAIVLTSSRDGDADLWSIYDVSLATNEARVLVRGYRLRLLDWLGLTSPELGIAYFDCWGCEAATLFTTLHFTKGAGWSARWPNNKGDPQNPQPGAVVSYGDAGEPYDDNEVDQIFAVLSQPDGSFAAGSWFRSRNPKTGKIDEDVEKYFVDQTTGADRVEKLSGAQAFRWERQICTESKNAIKLSVGQGSETCSSALRTQAPHGVISK